MDILHIGLGIRGRHWLEIVRDRPDTTSTACVDPEVSACDWTKTHFPGVSCYTDLRDALRHTNADAAIIASPPALHAAHAIEALEAGLAVMIEKPFATSLAEGAKVVEVSHRTGCPLMVAQNYRYLRCERTLQELVRTGKVGTITHVSCIDRRARPTTGNFLSQIEYAQVLDVGADHFDSLRSIFGVNPVAVMARCGTTPWNAYGHGSTTEAILEMEHNIDIHYYGTLTSHRDQHMLWIEGNKGILWADRKRVWWRKRGSRFFLPVRMRKMPRGDALKYPREGTATLLDQLNAAVRAGQVPETNGADNLWTLSMVKAAMHSDKTGKAVRINDVFASAGMTQALATPLGQDMTS